jgi:TonB family protein
VTPSPNDYFLKAQVLYELERYQDAIQPVQQAIEEAAEPNRNHYELLLALQYETNDEAGARRTLDVLNERWPNTEQATAFDAHGTVNDAVAKPGFGVSDGEYLPIVKVQPIYPQRALRDRIEGHVIVSFTVTTTGETDNVRVVESSSPIFDTAAIESAKKYKYKPRIVDGKPVAVDGVETRIEFTLQNDV